MKIVVTKENVHKMSESTLIKMLDTLADDSSLAAAIEAELDGRAFILNQAIIKMKKRRELDIAKLAQLKSEVSSLFETLKSDKITKLIEIFGDDFADDYNYNPDTFTITSSVAHKSPNFKTDKYEHENEEEALKHFKYLLYNRIYDRRMRDTNADSLSILKLKLEQIK